MTSNDNDRAIVTAIMALANSLRLQVIAEGVETCAQFEALTALNCDFAQGYFMAKPMPAEQIVLNAVVEPCAEQGTPGGILKQRPSPARAGNGLWENLQQC
jgi:EAL domain-containing protein (putative c-di-GMP-specific phosphodiesterase class I)